MGNRISHVHVPYHRLRNCVELPRLNSAYQLYDDYMGKKVLRPRTHATPPHAKYIYVAHNESFAVKALVAILDDQPTLSAS